MSRNTTRILCLLAILIMCFMYFRSTLDEDGYMEPKLDSINYETQSNNNITSQVSSNITSPLTASYIKSERREVSLLLMLADIFKPPRLEQKLLYTGPNLWDSINDKPATRPFNCSNLFSSLLSSNSNPPKWPPPRDIPPEKLGAYTLDGNVALHKLYKPERRVEIVNGFHWQMETIASIGAKKSTCGHYQLPQCERAFSKYRSAFKDKVGIIFGSQIPWAEAAFLEAGAKYITTVEYSRITTDHPSLSIIHPSSLARSYLKGDHQLADFAFSFSSFEHDGLGRYGDPLNPYADLESIARVHCLLKKGGLFFLALPIGADRILFNAHRVYGKHRSGMILSHWEPVDLIGATVRFIANASRIENTNQPIWVLRKQ